MSREAVPESASAHSGLNRPRSRDFSCAINASVGGRNAHIADIPGGVANGQIAGDVQRLSGAAQARRSFDLLL